MTADTTLRGRIALAIGAHRNGPASDGQGWYRDQADAAACYALADVVLPVVAAERARELRLAADDLDLDAGLRDAEGEAQLAEYGRELVAMVRDRADATGEQA